MINGETLVIYGDLMIWNCLTPPGGFQQEQIFDETRTDLLYYKFTIRVIGYMNALTATGSTLYSGQCAPVMGVLPNSGDPSTALRQQKTRYTVAPRKHFEMRMGAQVGGFGNIIDAGNAILVCDPILDPGQINSLTNSDVNSGPKCTHFDVTHIVADNLLRVEAEFEICKIECDPNLSVANSSGVLNNRWSVIDVVDNDQMTTRTITGRLRTISSVINANSFRSFILPPLQPGMRRDSMEFTASDDGLHLLYTIVDKEIAFSAPAPATRWNLEHKEIRNREALSCIGEVNITMAGNRNVDKKKLISVAAAMAQAKLLSNDPKTVLLEIAVGDVYGTDGSYITLSARGMRFPKDGAAVLGIPTKIIGKPIAQADLALVVQNYDRNFSLYARAGENTAVEGPIQMIGAFAAYLQSPCSTAHEIFQAKLSAPSKNPAANSQPTEIKGSVSTSQDLTDDATTNFFNNGGQTAIYTYYQMESTYPTTYNRAHCPIAQPKGTSAGNPSQATSICITLAPPMAQRRVRIRAERVGAWPDLPTLDDSQTPDSNGIVYTMLDAIDHPTQPQYSADGKRIYLLDREYVFALSRAPLPTDSLPVGVDPWSRDGLLRKTYDPGKTEGQYPLA